MGYLSVLESVNMYMSDVVCRRDLHYVVWMRLYLLFKSFRCHVNVTIAKEIFMKCTRLWYVVTKLCLLNVSAIVCVYFARKASCSSNLNYMSEFSPVPINILEMIMYDNINCMFEYLFPSVLSRTKHIANINWHNFWAMTYCHYRLCLLVTGRLMSPHGTTVLRLSVENQ